MENKNYVFQISAYDTESLLPQVSKALEKSVELVSRERYPGLWKYTDKLNAMTESVESIKQGQTWLRPVIIILSVVCLVLGSFLLLLEWGLRLMEPQGMSESLLVSIVAIAIGIGGLLYGLTYKKRIHKKRTRKKNPFDKSARLVLEGKDTVPTEQPIAVSFSETGMTIPIENSSTEFVPYNNFQCGIETADVLLFTFDGRVTILQKIDLVTENIVDFRKFISEKVAKYQSIT